MVAVNDDGRVIGFYVWVVVDPDHRGRGAGSELYAGALALVKSEGATRLASEVRDNCPVSLQFARRRGFEIADQSFQSALDLTTFDDSPYSGLIEDLQAAGIRFFSLAPIGDSEPWYRPDGRSSPWPGMNGWALRPHSSSPKSGLPTTS